MMSFIYLLLFFLLFHDANSETLQVHIIAHSHCDPGWLDTFEQYYRRDVSRILTGVTRALSSDRSKRFIWSEISFFMRWWNTQNEQVKRQFKTLVANGQLEFVGGGWVQNDEMMLIIYKINHLSIMYAYMYMYVHPTSRRPEGRRRREHRR